MNYKPQIPYIVNTPMEKGILREGDIFKVDINGNVYLNTERGAKKLQPFQVKDELKQIKCSVAIEISERDFRNIEARYKTAKKMIRKIRKEYQKSIEK